MNFGTIPASIDEASTDLEKPVETGKTCRPLLLLVRREKEE
jgi:hypothetical protein